MAIVLNLHLCKTFIYTKRAIKDKFSISLIQLLILLKKYLNIKILLQLTLFIYSLFFIKNKICFVSNSTFLLTKMIKFTLNFVNASTTIYRRLLGAFCVALMIFVLCFLFGKKQTKTQHKDSGAKSTIAMLSKENYVAFYYAKCLHHACLHFAYILRTFCKQNVPKCSALHFVNKMHLQHDWSKCIFAQKMNYLY